MQLQRAAKIPACHHIGEGVVIDDLVVFVRTDDRVDVHPASRVAATARRPVSCCIDHEIGARAGHEFGVAGPVRVEASGPGDVSRDVLLVLPGANDHLTSRLVAHALRGHIFAGDCGFPRESRPVLAERGSTRSRRRQTPDPVFEHRARCSRMGEHKKWKDEHVGIPEHVSAVLVHRSGREHPRTPRRHQAPDRSGGRGRSGQRAAIRHHPRSRHPPAPSVTPMPHGAGGEGRRRHQSSEH